MSDSPGFDQYDRLPPHLVNPAKQVMQFTGYFLDVNTQVFDWARFKDAIDNRPDVDMVIEHFDSNQITQQENTVEVMVDKITDRLMKAANIVIDKLVLAEIILNAYTSLGQKEDAGFASFEEEGSNAAFTYRLLLTVTNPHVPDDFYTLVTTIKLVADFQDKSTWLGLAKDSCHNFGAELNTMRLAVTKDFISGPKPPL